MHALIQNYELDGLCCHLAGFSGRLARQIQRLTTMNESQINRKVFLRLLGHPVVIAPFVLGVTACTAFWALSWPGAVSWFACAAGALGSFGTYVTRLVMDNGKTARAVLAEEELGEQRAGESALDALDKRLVEADNDPRPETALRDMRALMRAFDDFIGKADSPNAPAVIEVRSRVRQLFDYSIRSLERTLQLGDTAKLLNMPTARKPLLAQREKIIEDIEACAKQFGDTLATLQRLDSGNHSGSDLSRLRDDLDQSLQIAGRVEERLNSFLDQTDSTLRSQPPRESVANPQKGN